MVQTRQPSQPPTVSVVVVSFNQPELLERCLTALEGQGAAEIIVVDASDEDPGPQLTQRFEAVTFVHFDEPRSIPQLRWEGVRRACGDVIAQLESTMEPAAGWVEALRAAHRDGPAGVVGGPVAFQAGPDSSAFRWADFFYEYGRHMAPKSDGFAKELTGANCSYRRSAIEECLDLLEDGAWEGPIHDRLRQQGGELWRASGAAAFYRGEPRFPTLIRQRFHYGRWHAGERRKAMSLPGCVMRAALVAFVPFVLYWRLWKSLDQDFRFGSSDGTSLHPHPAKRNHFSTRKRRRLRRDRSSPLLAPHGG